MTRTSGGRKIPRTDAPGIIAGARSRDGGGGTAAAPGDCPGERPGGVDAADRPAVRKGGERVATNDASALATGGGSAAGLALARWPTATAGDRAGWLLRCARGTDAAGE